MAIIVATLLFAIFLPWPLAALLVAFAVGVTFPPIGAALSVLAACALICLAGRLLWSVVSGSTLMALRATVRAGKLFSSPKAAAAAKEAAAVLQRVLPR